MSRRIVWNNLDVLTLPVDGIIVMIIWNLLQRCEGIILGDKTWRFDIPEPGILGPQMIGERSIELLCFDLSGEGWYLREWKIPELTYFLIAG